MPGRFSIRSSAKSLSGDIDGSVHDPPGGALNRHAGDLNLIQGLPGIIQIGKLLMGSPYRVLMVLTR